MARIFVYDEPGRGGSEATFTDSAPDLRVEYGRGDFEGDWNDEIQSFHVESGVWQLFEHVEYGGLGTRHFGPGTTGNCPEFGFPNKWVSSIRKISD